MTRMARVSVLNSKCPLGLRHIMPALLVCLIIGVQWTILDGRAEDLPVPIGAPDPIEGIWLGTITAPQGSTADIGFEFSRAKGGSAHLQNELSGNVHLRISIHDTLSTRTVAAIIPSSLSLTSNCNLWATGSLARSARAGCPSRSSGVSKFSAALPAEHYPAPPAPLWKFDLGAGTWAPPVVAGDLVYVGTNAGFFHAVHASDGTSAWSWKGANGIDARAVVGTDAVYVLDTKTNLIALDRASGALRWLTPLHDEQLAGAPAPSNPTFNHRAATPLLIGGTIYCGSSDGGIYAIDASTGASLAV